MVLNDLDFYISPAFGTMLKNIREEKGLTQKDVALLNDLHKFTIIKMEGGNFTVEISLILPYLNSLGIRVENKPIMDFTPQFEVKSNQVIHLIEPKFTAYFSRNKDLSYSITKLDMEDSPIDLGLFAHLITKAGDLYYEYLDNHSPIKK